MNHLWYETNDLKEVEYSWKLKGNDQKMKVSAIPIPIEIPLGCETEFITEHYWGTQKLMIK